MKDMYSKPIITIEELSKSDVLCDSENAYLMSSELNKKNGQQTLWQMIQSGSIWD